MSFQAPFLLLGEHLRARFLGFARLLRELVALRVEVGGNVNTAPMPLHPSTLDRDTVFPKHFAEPLL